VTQPLGQGAFEDRYCREYQTTSRVGGRLQPSYGTACYQPDGSWQIVAD
jgi:surface antigen